jgi:8-oxo-dGTP diphosphatase
MTPTMKILPQRLETERLVLKRPEPGDADELAALLDDWEVARWLAQVPFPYTPSDARDWIGQAARNWNRGVNYQFAVYRRGPGGRAAGMVGHMGLRRGPRDLDADTAELGYWFGRDHWGRGYATEAARAAIDFGFDGLGLAAIWASALPDNDRSLAVLAKAGLVETGAMRQTYAPRNATLEVPVLTIERAGWRAAAGGRPSAMAGAGGRLARGLALFRRR